MFFVVIARLSFIETDTFTSRSKSCGQSSRVSGDDTSASVTSVMSSEYCVPLTENGMIRAKPCADIPGIARRPN